MTMVNVHLMDLRGSLLVIVSVVTINHCSRLLSQSTSFFHAVSNGRVLYGYTGAGGGHTGIYSKLQGFLYVR